MARFLHFLVVAIYVVVPLAAVGLAIYRHRRDREQPGVISSLIITSVCGIAVGVSLVLIYATGTWITVHSDKAEGAHDDA